MHEVPAPAGTISRELPTLSYTIPPPYRDIATRAPAATPYKFPAGGGELERTPGETW